MRDQVQVRKADKHDKDQIIQITEYFERDYLQLVIDKWIDMYPGGMFVAEKQSTDEIIGCCQLKFHSFHQAWLCGMRIIPPYQQYGIGALITKELLKQSYQEGSQVSRLVTHYDNKDAQKLALKLGFNVEGTWKIFFHHDLPNNRGNVNIYELPPEQLRNNAMTYFFSDYSFAKFYEHELPKLEERTCLKFETGAWIIGKEIVGREGERVFIVNNYDVANMSLQHVLEELAAYLNTSGYQKICVAIPLSQWEDAIKAETISSFPEEEGNTFYLMTKEH